MSLIQPKQIGKYLQAWVGISGFSTSGGTSDTITTGLTTALNTAGNGGTSVPLQVGNSTQEGVNTASGFNVTDIYSASTGQRLVDGSGNDVYAQITNSGSVWTLSYYSNISGTATAYTMPASTSINFEVPYIFSFNDLPYTAIVALVSRHIAPDLATFGFRMQGDALTVTAANTLSALSQSAKGAVAMLVVNGQTMTNLGSAPPFTVSGTAITWSSANAGYALATTDDVKAFYNY